MSFWDVVNLSRINKYFYSVLSLRLNNVKQNAKWIFTASYSLQHANYQSNIIIKEYELIIRYNSTILLHKTEHNQENCNIIRRCGYRSFNDRHKQYSNKHTHLTLHGNVDGIFKSNLENNIAMLSNQLKIIDEELQCINVKLVEPLFLSYYAYNIEAVLYTDKTVNHTHAKAIIATKHYNNKFVVYITDVITRTYIPDELDTNNPHNIAIRQIFNEECIIYQCERLVDYL